MSVPPPRRGRARRSRTLPAIASTSTGHSGRGRSWPMSATQQQVARRGSSSAVRSPPSGEISVSSRPWITSVGHVERGERLGAVAAGVDRRQLTRGALRVERAVEAGGRQRLGPRPRRSTSSSARPSPAPTPRCTPRVRSAVVPAAPRGPPASVPRPEGRRCVLMIDVRLATRVGVLDRHRLHDHPAHRRAGDVGPFDAEVVEQADPVGGHVGQRVGDLRQRVAGELRRHHGHRVGALPVELASTARSRGCRSG